MKYLLILAVSVVATQANLFVDQQWLEFKSTHGKQYKNVVEESARFNIFLQNLERIEEHNKKYERGESTFEMGVTPFADLTAEEFMERMNLKKQLRLSANLEDNNIDLKTYVAPEGKVMAAKLDWREKGAVTKVKNQGQCGSCWSFSATGSMEGQNQIKNKKLISLSEQNLVDCSRDYGNAGCNGGLEIFAFAYVKDHGITTEEKYPYLALDKKCHFNESDSVLKVSGFQRIPSKNESALLSAVNEIGPISVGIHATANLQHYKKGILDDSTCSQTELNHSVLLVGYGEDYYLIKNSWSEAWGEEGYFRYPRGKNACGIATDASFPVL